MAHPGSAAKIVAAFLFLGSGHCAASAADDRGPFTRGRVIDLTPAAARALGFSGVARVKLSVVK